jgi:O-antigen/teichoic acid export membrane protein
MTHKKILGRIKTISFYGMSQLLSVFSVLLLSLVIVKYHSVVLWGEYVELLIWSNFFLLFLSFGNHDYLLKSFSKTPSTINQQWSNNILVRSLFLLPSFVLIFFIPIFNKFEILVFLLIFLQFIAQSFKVLIVYHRKFSFNIWVEIGVNIVLFLLVYFQFETFNLKILLISILVSQFFKVICYSFYFLRSFQKIKIKLQVNELKKSTPFFIPLLVGTIRTKVDAYYGTHFFNLSNLSKYQIFISFLGLAQMVSSFVITPYLKNFYRSKNTLINRIQKMFFIYGWIFALLMSGIMFVLISKIYKLDFTLIQYFLAFLFMVPLFLHVLIVSEYYKKGKQNKIALFASIVVALQIILGYFLIKFWNINGALMLKTFGQWTITVILWIWIKQKTNVK